MSRLDASFEMISLRLYIKSYVYKCKYATYRQIETFFKTNDIFDALMACRLDMLHIEIKYEAIKFINT